MNQPQNIICHHVLIIHSLVAACKVQHTVVEALTFLLQVHSHILEFIMMCIKDMDSDIKQSILPQLFTRDSTSLVITQEALNHCNKAVPRCFLLPSELGEFLALQDHIYL